MVATTGIDRGGGQYAAAPYPDGLAEDHLRRRGALHRHASPLSIVGLGLILAGAAAGFGGGTGATLHVADAPDGRIEVEAPATLRNGEFFEMRVRMDAVRALDDMVMAVTPALWQDITQNTMIPAAAEESFEDGWYRFSYGPQEAGAEVALQMDFQINPPLFKGRSGEIALFDGERQIATIPLSTKVLP